MSSSLNFGRPLNAGRAVNAGALNGASLNGFASAAVGTRPVVTSGDLTRGDGLDVQTTMDPRTGERGVYITPQAQGQCAGDICANGPVVLRAQRRVRVDFGPSRVVEEIRDECDGHIVEQVHEAPVVITSTDYDLLPQGLECLPQIYAPIVQSIGVLRRHN